MSDPIELRQYVRTIDMPEAVLPFDGTEQAELWQGDAVTGQMVRVPYNLLQGDPIAHKLTHELNGDDQLGSSNPTPNTHVISSGTGKIDGWVSDGSETVKGKVQFASDGESVAAKAVQANDTRLSDVRTPTAHGSTHTILDPIPTATEEAAGLMSATDKIKLDGLSPGSGDLGSVLTAEAADLGVTYDETDMFTHSKFSKAYGKEIGELFYLEHRKTPVTWDESKSSTHTDYPEYFPAIPRYDGNHDITSAMAPLLVAELASKFITVGSTSVFSGTLASGVITLPATTDGDHLLIALVNAALVLRWRDSNQSATYEALGGLYTGTGQYCLRTGNVNYAITLVNAVARTITIASPPADGAVDFTIPQYGVAGTDTTIRLRQLSGFVPVACGDYDGEVLEGLAKMDRMQKFKVTLTNTWDFGGPGGAGKFVSSGGVAYNATILEGGMGHPRITGKTTDPRGHGTVPHTWARTLLESDWT